jgi:hypothetical protein
MSGAEKRNEGRIEVCKLPKNAIPDLIYEYIIHNILSNMFWPHSGHLQGDVITFVFL